MIKHIWQVKTLTKVCFKAHRSEIIFLFVARRIQMKNKNKPLYISLKGRRNKDFHVRVLKDERLIDSLEKRDAMFDEDMYNYGDMDNLPNSDKIIICQNKGIKQENCQIDK